MKDLKVKKLHSDAIMPTRATENSAGLDLYALEDFSIPGSAAVGNGVRIGRYQAKTGIAVAIDPGFEGTVRPRSGHAFNSETDGFFGTIDADYRGELRVLLYNTGYTERHFKKGDRIAQLVISPIAAPTPVDVDELSKTKRGEGGLGHTGK